MTLRCASHSDPEGFSLPEQNRRPIWIDLDNSPHVPFFKPIINELGRRGYPVTLTARDRFQVCGLADRVGLRYRAVGKYSGKNKAVKALCLLYRALLLLPGAWKEKPCLALSHGSRSQLLAAALLRIPSVLIFDYEHSSRLPFANPDRVIVPERIPRQGIRVKCREIVHFPGIKEDVYVPFFVPDPAPIRAMGLDDREILVTLRPPATEAHYHNPESEELFHEVVDYLCDHPETRLVILPRTRRQEAEIRKQWADPVGIGKILLPGQALDGLNLIWHSDLVVSGGGTMNREAAALGVPVYSIFRGTTGAVDRYLSESGRMVLLADRRDIRSKVEVKRRVRPDLPAPVGRDTFTRIMEGIIESIPDRS